MARELRTALLHFEPRLISHTVRVHANSAREVQHNVISFRIEAQLWSQPVPLEIFMRTDIDLESGRTQVVEARPANGSRHGNTR
jgi:type VI secretion system protein ImpF